ncbi:MAG: DUF2079 domain-containing protein, partial [Victivallaceae bacterium]
MKLSSFYMLLALLAGAVLGYAVYLNAYLLDAVGIITYEYMLRGGAVLPWTGWYFAGLGVLFVAGFYRFCRMLDSQTFNWKVFAIALLPLLIFFPTFFFSMGFYSPMIFTVVIGWTIFRLALVMPVKQKWKPEISNRTGLLIVVLLFAVFTCWFAYIQQRAVNILFLSYHDWGLYFNIIDNTLKGKWFYSDITQGSQLPLHFEPGMVLLLAPYVWLFRTPAAFFVLTSGLLFCGSIFTYIFARKL